MSVEAHPPAPISQSSITIQYPLLIVHHGDSKRLNNIGVGLHAL